MFTTVLIANRGCIATRILRTLKNLNVKSVAVYHEHDADSLHVRLADTAVSLGDGSIADTYLNIKKIIQVARQTGAQAIHPGYGFLSENENFVAACEEAGHVFIGPTPQQINLFGLKHQARDIAQKAGVPMLSGSELLKDLASALKKADEVTYPVMLKTTAGGGGIGMKICTDKSSLEQAWDSVKHLGSNYFSNDGVFIEKYIANARHIEVQIFGDGQGTTIALGERDCSAQRRNQKVIEETPAPNLSDEVRSNLCATAEKLMASVNYRNAGTVEFIFDADANAFYFLEVNTRLQVEHGVTEEVWGVDLVEWMLKLAAGDLEPLQKLGPTLSPQGHAIQVRLYAENVSENFRPSPGFLSSVQFRRDDNMRIDTWVESGMEVSALFDPMIAKVIAKGDNRQQALDTLNNNLAFTTLYGTETNLLYLQQVLAADVCQQGQILTRTLGQFDYHSCSITVLQPGTMTSIQDYPGRTDLWHVGVPPSGPMDNLHFQLANKLVNNSDRDAALEITLNGPSLRFNTDSVIAICGAALKATLNDLPLPLFKTVKVRAGDVLDCAGMEGSGARAYLAVKGGIQCPDYLGSRSTFTLGQFGGHNGRALKAGDVLHIAPLTDKVADAEIPEAQRPPISSHWDIRVLYGPHGAPDFFTEDDIDQFFDHTWEVHYNSSRTGVRLIGPKPEWARQDGGEAGLHPSNIHDNAYAFGTVDFTGDMPVILGPDGPSLGGFVCPATVIQADLWKLGQLASGSTVRFIPVALEDANRESARQREGISKARFSAQPDIKAKRENPVFFEGSFAAERLRIRLAGDQFILIELGEQELNIERRLIIHALMTWIQEHMQSGILELTPGIRSLQIHYQPERISVTSLVELVQQASTAFTASDNITVPTRIVHLPLSWNDEACKLAIEKYMQSVRKDAPWCPSNLEFIRRINGLPDIQAVKDIVFSASYLVMGLGDVYLGAPVATPLDPRHRLVTTKYNPARTWTAENSVGIGGAYMCIYGMEGPGGYQFVGRTLQMWNRYHRTAQFQKPWLLRFFDQIRFYEVSSEELSDIRKKFPLGQYPIKIEESVFSLNDYRNMLDEAEAEIQQFQQQRSTAFAEELEHWKQTGQLTYQQKDAVIEDSGTDEIPEGMTAAYSPASGNIWTILKNAGDSIEKNDTCLVLESMKMEIEIPASCAGKIHKFLCSEGQTVSAGQVLFWIE